MNNYEENYQYAINKGENITRGGYNPQGTGMFELKNCRVTAVVLKSGVSVNDEIVGKPVVINPGTTLPKLVDLDPSEQGVPVIYGMKLGINWKSSKYDKNAFLGDFVPAVLSQDQWQRLAFTTAEDHSRGVHTVSRLTNVQWADHLPSAFLRQLKDSTLKDEKDGYTLSVMLAMFNYSEILPDSLFLYGNVVGSIGIALSNESVMFPASRVMSFTKNPPLPIPHFSVLCARYGDWMSTTYFHVFDSTLTIDFSNSLTLDIDGKLCHLHQLFIGVLIDDQTVDVIDEISYMKKDWYKETSGIHDQFLTSDQVLLSRDHKFVAIMFMDEPTIFKPKKYKICNNNNVVTTQTSDNCVFALLREEKYFVRPTENYIHRLERGDSANIKLKVRQYGFVPQKQIMVTVCDASAKPASKSDLFYPHTQQIDATGIATFNFVAGDVGNLRKGIDSQIFKFMYCIFENTVNCIQCNTNDGNQIALLIWTPMNYNPPYYWDPHIEPIFTQYQYLYPVMDNILKLGDYDDVTKPRNINLIIFAMSLDKNNPDYMPTTRDLSPTKVKMITDWLKTYDHPRNREDQYLYNSLPFCQNIFFFHDEKIKIVRLESLIEEMYPLTANYFQSKLSSQKQSTNSLNDKRIIITHSELAQTFVNIASVQFTLYDKVGMFLDHMIKNTVESSTVEDSDRLSGSLIERLYAKVEAMRYSGLKNANSAKITSLPNWYTENQCSEKVLREALQHAIEVEFFTIPLYLTALYSIKDGYNQEAYEIIRSVVMQEMLHLAQAANLLIAIGGRPIIDSAQAAPSYPSRLPAGLLPGLNVTLQKASPKHIADVFMMIEFPENIVFEDPLHNKRKIGTHFLTIGKLYGKIQLCMKKLHSKRKKTLFRKESKQMSWPWKTNEEGIKLWTVTNIDEANEAINMITEQGEGTEQRDPTYLKTSQLAHFFKFETLACKHQLRILHDYDQHTYDFNGKPIQFTSKGVWPMQNNPSSKGILKKLESF